MAGTSGTLAALQLAAACSLILGFGVPIAIADLRERRVPNRLSAWLSLSAAVLLTLVAGVAGSWRMLAVPCMYGAGAGLAAVCLSLVAPTALGMGDAKLLPALVALAAWCSQSPLTALLLGAWLASATGAAAAVALRLRRGSWPATIAYAPHLLASAAVVCLAPV